MVNTGVDLKEFKKIPKKDNIFRIIFAGGGTLQKGYHYSHFKLFMSLIFQMQRFGILEI